MSLTINPLFTYEDIKNSFYEAIQKIDSSISQTMKSLYENDKDFESNAHAVITDMATKVSAMECLDEEGWSTFSQKLKTQEIIPQSYHYQYMADIVKTILKTHLGDTNMNNPSDFERQRNRANTFITCLGY